MPHTDSASANLAKTAFLAAIYFPVAIPVAVANRAKDWLYDRLNTQLDEIEHRAYAYALRNFQL